MPYCPACGAHIVEGSTFCPSCGRRRAQLSATPKRVTTATDDPFYWCWLGGAALILLGTVLPWASVVDGFERSSLVGIDTPDGQGLLFAAIGLGAVGVYAMFFVPTTWLAGPATMLAVGCFALAVYDWSNIATFLTRATEAEVAATHGVGLFVIIGGSMVAVLGAGKVALDPKR